MSVEPAAEGMTVREQPVMDFIHGLTFPVYIPFQIRIFTHPHFDSAFGSGIAKRRSGVGDDRTDAPFPLFNRIHLPFDELRRLVFPISLRGA